MSFQQILQLIVTVITGDLGQLLCGTIRCVIETIKLVQSKEGKIMKIKLTKADVEGIQSCFPDCELSDKELWKIAKIILKSTLLRRRMRGIATAQCAATDSPIKDRSELYND